jgi:hypothetical protein
MNKLFLSLAGLTILFSVTSLSLKQSPPPATFEKIIFVEINAKEDSSLFKPYSKAWRDAWHIVDVNLFSNGSELMNAEKYEFAFNGRTENLWTLIHPKLIKGELTLYSPYDPNMLGLSGYDDGELRYPVKGENPDDNFLNSENLRNNMAYYLGWFGPMGDVPLVDEFGEPVIVTLDDGTMEYQYPAPDFDWFRDSDLIKYKIRVRIVLNKNGKEKKRIIEAIAPMTFDLDRDKGEIIGERELLWIDYKELKPMLKEGYFLDKNGKPETYLKYIENKVKTASL